MSKKFLFAMLGLSFAATALPSARADDASPAPVLATSAAPIPTAEQVTGALREKLFPVVESTLQEYCGSDCPSFKIDPQFKKAAASGLDDLGFSSKAQLQEAPELKSVSVAVLVNDKVSQGARDSLKQIIAHRLGNDVTVPVTVQLKLQSSVPPVFDRLRNPVPVTARSPWFDLVGPLAWPAAMLLLGTLALFGLMLFLRHQRRIYDQAAEQARLQWEATGAPETDGTLALGGGLSSVTGLLQERIKDLQWLIEEAAARKDVATLAKVISLFPAQELSAKLQLSELALRTIARLPDGESTGVGGSEDQAAQAARLAWIPQALERAHWRRMEEERNPLVKLDRLSEEQLRDVFVALPSLGEKSVMISSVRQERWPFLLSQLGSSDRVQLGLMLSQYQKAPPTDRRAMEAALIQRVSETLNESSGVKEGVVEDFSLYLPEKEGQRLWQELSLHSRPASTVSVDSLLEGLDSRALLEICMNVDVKTLQSLLPTVSATTRAKVTEALPKALRDRLLAGMPGALAGSGEPDGADALAMQARAELVGAYRRFQARA